MEDMKLPFVSKELCEHLRDAYSLPLILAEVCAKAKNADVAVGVMTGINMVIERLEGIKAQQEENNGLRG